MYDVLFKPIKNGKVELKNRFAISVIDSGTATNKHLFLQRSIDYFAA